MARAATTTIKKTATKTRATAAAAKKPAKATPKPAGKTVSKTETVSKATATLASAVKSATNAAPTPKVVTAVSKAPVGIVAPESLEMKKKELIDKVVLRSGIKKKDAKPVIEAMLAVLGETLADGRPLNLQPLGKVKINRMKQVAKDRVIICKIRQSGRAIADINAPQKTPLAGAVE